MNLSKLSQYKCELTQKVETYSYLPERWVNKKGTVCRFGGLPAVITATGKKEWYHHNKLHRDNDLPALIIEKGDMFWFQYDLLHRDNDLPAIVYASGDKQWFQRGIHSRPSGGELTEFAPRT
jgi:hypothetical protein